MKIIQILPGFTVGGPTISVTSLARHLSLLGNEVQFYAKEDDFTQFNDLDIHPFNTLEFPFNSQFAFSITLYKELCKECKNADIIQTNSLWQFPNIVHEFARRGTHAKSVIVPRGTLSEYALSLSSLKKKFVLSIGQSIALKKADMFIATCEKEYEDIRKFGLSAPVAIIPNGLELPQFEHKFNKTKTIAFLARIHKVKGVDILLKAWQKIQSLPFAKDWDFKIAGPLNTDYAKEMQQLSRDLKCERVSFIGALHGKDKFEFLSNASIYVLPSYTENFGITVTEALACETPVITTKGTPWQGLETKDCGKWIELSVDSLIEAMNILMQLPLEELALMGKRGRNWVEHDFDWTEIAKRTQISYEWLQNPRNECPEWIRIN